MSLPLSPLAQVVSTTRAVSRGVGMISGVTSIDGTPAPCKVFLYTVRDVLIGFRRTGSDGVYSFPSMAPGRYYLVIGDDNQGTHRSKVEHVEVT